MAGSSIPPGLVDTDILVDAARGVSESAAWVLARQQSGEFQISIISAMELVAGCRDKRQLAQVQQFLRTIRLLPVTDVISQEALRLVESFHLSHGLQIPDALVGATALVQQLPLYTRNLRHYRMLPGLTLLRPY